MADPNVDLLKQFMAVMEQVAQDLATIRADIRTNARKHEATQRKLDALKKTLTRCGPSWVSIDYDSIPWSMRRVIRLPLSKSFGKLNKR